MKQKRAEELSPVGGLLEDTLERVAQIKKMTNLECQQVAMTFAVMVILNLARGDVEAIKKLMECSDTYANIFKKRLLWACEVAIKVYSEKDEDDDRREKDPC